MTLRASDLDVSEAKLRDYLLAPEHPDGRGKALFFLATGFTRDDPVALEYALRTHATGRSATAELSPFGERLVVDGPLETPSGRIVSVRTVWFRDAGSERVRLVTAYPIRL